ncbi:hypothetical protein N431DRAFT_471135 [Stipitochalara longipes BDJ]|nr:hypothetical protein N431DRAFT_471135 [Stipitochalara longipes BDJ]
MTWQDSYTPVVPTTPVGEYSTSLIAYATTTTPLPYCNYHQNNDFTTITTTATAFCDVGDDWKSQISGPTRDQAAIIALGIICGLLVIGLALLLFFLFYQGRREVKKMEGELVISQGYRAMGRHKHRRDRMGSSKGGTDEMTDYIPSLKGFYASKRHRGHRRSQPVTCQDFERLQRTRINPAWENAGVQQPRDAYAQFANTGAPTCFPSASGNAQAVPVMQIPLPTQGVQQQRGFEEVMSATEQSEVSSNSHDRPSEHRQS